MTARMIDGKQVAKVIREECALRVIRPRETARLTPGLAVILVGDDEASKLYVRNKLTAARSIGVTSRLYELPSGIDPDVVKTLIDELNADEDVHGILVQLPLPSQFNIHEILHKISPDKDVDGFHLYNVGGLVVGQTVFPSCTPYGVMKLLAHEKINLTGRNVVIVGASNIVGKPMALMMLHQEATVTVCHKQTRDLGQYTILADVLIVAAGVPKLIVRQMVRKGAVVIDVGINRLPDGKVVGDVDFENVRDVASAITPVPGGFSRIRFHQRKDRQEKSNVITSVPRRKWLVRSHRASAFIS